MTTTLEPEVMERIASLIRTLQEETELLAGMEERVAQQRWLVRDLEENILPEAFEDAGVESVPVREDLQAKLDVTYHGHIKEQNRHDALAYLYRTGHQKLLKTEITLKFGMNEREYAEEFARLVKEHLPLQPITITIDGPLGQDALGTVSVLANTVLPKREFSSQTDIHPSSLKAYIKRQFEKGDAEWPAELFGAFRKTIVKLIRLEGDGR